MDHLVINRRIEGVLHFKWKPHLVLDVSLLKEGGRDYISEFSAWLSLLSIRLFGCNQTAAKAHTCSHKKGSL